jgi:hypothetical protein
MSQFQTHGICTLSNTAALAIEINNSGDGARVKLVCGDVISRPKWQEIKYDMEGTPFVTWKGSRFDLGEFTKFSMP